MEGRRDAPGVYVNLAAGEAKIAALGLKVKNGCTYHGVSLNIRMDLAPFLAIDPCGYPGLAVTQTSALGITDGFDDLARALAASLKRMLEAPCESAPAAPHQPAADPASAAQHESTTP